MNDGQYEFLCLFCGQIFELKSHASMHFNNKHDKNKFKCHICLYKTGKKLNLKHHLDQHGVSEKKFKCSRCNYGANEYSTVTDHNNKHH